jgi:hypothetical protein
MFSKYMEYLFNQQSLIAYFNFFYIDERNLMLVGTVNCTGSP